MACVDNTVFSCPTCSNPSITFMAVRRRPHIFCKPPWRLLCRHKAAVWCDGGIRRIGWNYKHFHVAKWSDISLGIFRFLLLSLLFHNNPSKAKFSYFSISYFSHSVVFTLHVALRLPFMYCSVSYCSPTSKIYGNICFQVRSFKY